MGAQMAPHGLEDGGTEDGGAEPVQAGRINGMESPQGLVRLANSIAFAAGLSDLATGVRV